MCQTGKASDKGCLYVSSSSGNGGPNGLKLVGVLPKIFIESFKGKGGLLKFYQ